jgi:hypothetical protein
MRAWSQDDLFDAVTPRPEPENGGSRQDGAFSAPQRSGKSFARGKLFVFEREQILVVRPYPDVRAWRKTKGHPEWRGVSPSLVSVGWPRAVRPRTASASDIAAVPEVGDPGDVRDRPDRSELAVAAFLGSVPPGVLDTVERFQNKHRIALLALLGRCPEALDIVQGNGCLAFMLALNRVFRRPAVADPWEAVRRWIVRRQRDALAWLGGWPSTESAARLTRKVSSESISVPFCFRLRSLLASPSETNPALLHLPRVTSDVVALLASPDVRDRVSPTMIEEVSAAKPDKTGRPRVFWLVRDALRLGAAAQGRLPRRFRSIREVQDVHGNLLGHFLDHADDWDTSELTDLEFPDPPIPVPRFTQPKELHIEPIRNGRELLEESKIQRNCVFSYASDIVGRRVAVYSVREPERATVSLVPGDHGGWVIDQFLAARNKPVRRETLLLVAAYLTRQQNKLFDGQNGTGHP